MRIPAIAFLCLGVLPLAASPGPARTPAQGIWGRHGRPAETSQTYYSSDRYRRLEVRMEHGDVRSTRSGNRNVWHLSPSTLTLSRKGSAAWQAKWGQDWKKEWEREIAITVHAAAVDADGYCAVAGLAFLDMFGERETSLVFACLDNRGTVLSFNAQAQVLGNQPCSSLFPILKGVTALEGIDSWLLRRIIDDDPSAEEWTVFTRRGARKRTVDPLLGLRERRQFFAPSERMPIEDSPFLVSTWETSEWKDSERTTSYLAVVHDMQAPGEHVWSRRFEESAGAPTLTKAIAGKQRGVRIEFREAPEDWGSIVFAADGVGELTVTEREDR